MKQKRLGIGIDNFEEMIVKNYYYIDKTDLIKKLLDHGSKVTLFTRPRRFGKSLNLSMLRCYFEKSEKDNGYLFDGLRISNEGEDYKKYLGKYPVIMLNFKEGKQDSFETSCFMLKKNISKEYLRHSKILESEALTKSEVDEYRRIQDGNGDVGNYISSVAFLSECLEKFYGEKVIVLIDEYDVPLENAYYRGFYDEMISFIRGMLSVALKTNESLEFAVLTGCLRISKESIFTGLNNLNIVSIQTPRYGEYFGFMQSEIEEMLAYYDKKEHREQIRQWYNGYLFGEEQVYNPWSVIKYVSNALDDDSYLPRPYWSNTSSNSIVKDLVARADIQVKSELERLVQGGTIEKSIQEDITYEDIYKNNDNLWNFLYFTGYLKKVSERFADRKVYVTMEIPNEEVKYIYETQIMEWVEEQVAQKDRSALYEATLSGDTKTIEEELKRALMETISYYDYNESYYHGFIGGLYKGMKEYLVQSNIECGLGRPDLLLTHVLREKAIIFEFKITKEYMKLEDVTQETVKQIRQKQYVEGIQMQGYKEIIAYGVGFCGKMCVIKEK